MIVHDPENNALRVDMLLMPFSNLDEKPYVDDRILNGYATGPKVRLFASGTWGKPQERAAGKGVARTRWNEGIDFGSAPWGREPNGSPANAGLVTSAR